MDLSLNTRIVVSVIQYLVLAAVACGWGYWLGRSVPVRFKGEKVLIGIFVGGCVALLTYGVEKLTGDGIRPLSIFTGFAFFFLQSIGVEIAAQQAARQRNKQL